MVHLPNNTEIRRRQPPRYGQEGDGSWRLPRFKDRARGNGAIGYRGDTGVIERFSRPQLPAADGSNERIVDRLFGPDAIANLLAHPGMREAVHMAATGAARQFDGDWARNRLLNDRGRFLMALLILDLHFTESGGSGVTGARLRREVADYGVCSAGRATGFLQALRLAKYLIPNPHPGLREKRLAPTSPFMIAHRQRWDYVFDAIAYVDPEAAARAKALSDPQLFGPATHTMAECFRNGLRARDVVPTLSPFLDHDAGFLILTTLFSLRHEPVTVARLAGHFSVSRAHVTEVLQRACEVGLARPASPRGGFAAGEGLEAVLAQFYALVFLIFLKALKATEEAAAAGA